MALRGSTRPLTNILLVGSVLIMSYLLLNTPLVHPKLGGGIGLGELVLDEIRIRLLPAPFGWDCRINQTYLQPDCEVIAHGYSQWIPAYDIRINNAGFRDRAYPLGKAADTYRILVLGDSLTFGVGVDNNETYPKVLEGLLNQHSETVTFDVLNLGIPGGSTDTEYLILQRYSNYSPDTVILQTFSNDASECAAFQGLPEESADRCYCMRFYLQKIQELAANLSAPLVIYEADHNGGSCLQQDSGSFYVRAGPFSGQRRYRVSRGDGHPNREGHSLMALDLLPAILNITASQVRT